MVNARDVSDVSTKMRASAAAACLLLAVAGGCGVSGSGETGVALFPGSVPVLAVGSVFDLTAADLCREAMTNFSSSGGGKIPTDMNLDVEFQTCELSPIDSVDAVSSAESVLAVESTSVDSGRAGITVRAEGDGEARLDVTFETGSGPREAAASFSVRTPNRVELSALCRGVPWTGMRLLALPALPVHLNANLFADDVPLYTTDPDRLEVDGVLLSQGANGYAELTPAPNVEEHTLTSPIDDDFVFTVEVVTPDDVDALSIETVDLDGAPRGSSAAGTDAGEAGTVCDTGLSVLPTIGGESFLCNGDIVIDVTVETPDSCSLVGMSDPITGNLLASRGRAGMTTVRFAENADACRVRVGVVDGTLSETLAIQRPCEL